MRRVKLSHGFLILLAATFSVSPALAESPIVKWQRIEGLIQTAPVGVVQPVGVPWTTTRGRAQVNLETGNLDFDVEGLVLAANPLPAAIIGTTGAVVSVKGTLVCNISAGGAVLADTPPVPLSPQGNADFHGVIFLPPDCVNAPGDMAFLLRVAAVVPGGPPLVNLWLAHGAVRKP